MQDCRNLKVWERSHELTLAVYVATQTFPKTETYGLKQQLRKSSTFVPSLIAEGCGRGSDDDFARFLPMAMGSASEADYQLLLSRDLGYLDASQYADMQRAVVEVKKMLTAFLARLRGRVRANGHAALTAES